MKDKLIIRGASEHNLKHIDLDLDKNSLIVISGLSGSGKSSLAFDTIFAEGQRRYVESLSSYARMFLGRLDKPEVELIEGLSPAISIEQKTTGHNPRSTVGTITEIYDYYRLLWARIGEVHCPQCGRTISRMSVDQIIETIYRRGGEGSRIMVMAPVALGRKGEYKKVLEDARKAGYQRVRIDGQMHMLDENIALDKQVKHTISIVVDRLILEKSARLRLADSIEKSTDMTDGLVEVTYIGQDKSESSEIYSEHNSCPHCGISIGEIQPRLFSFNNPFGACPECNGLGYKTEYDVDKIIPDRSKSFEEGAIASQNPNAGWGRAAFEAFAKSHGFSIHTPFNKLTEDQFHAVLYGSSTKFKMDYEDRMGSVSINRRWHGVINDLKRRYAETESVAIRTWINSFQTEIECPVCHGEKLRPEALSVFVGGKNINQATSMNISDSYDFFLSLNLTENEQKIAHQIMKEIKARLTFLKNVGLSYLTMNRSAGTLSGGEAQRIRLATQIGSALSGVLYVLDEPSIGAFPISF